MNPSLELKPFNTLGIEAQAKSVCIAGSAEEIYQQWLNAQKQQLPVLILGGEVMCYLLKTLMVR